MTTCDVAPCDEPAVRRYVVEDGQGVHHTHRCEAHKSRVELVNVLEWVDI